MLRQHFMYGRGISQVLLRYGLPGPGSSAPLLRGNNQPVAHRGVVHYLRRCAIGLGRLTGLIEEYACRTFKGSG
jgi:hypothetical protein